QLTQTGRGIDIVLAIDLSASMELEDLKPTRLEAAKRLARSFVQQRAGDRLGLVAFAGQAYSLVPLTTDYDLLLTNLRSLKPGLIEEDGTAIGTALQGVFVAFGWRKHGRQPRPAAGRAAGPRLRHPALYHWAGRRRLRALRPRLDHRQASLRANPPRRNHHAPAGAGGQRALLPGHR
nr:hypothetical protein [Tanacetum cinerariifolium]